MDDGLYKLLQQGVITPETALERAYDRSKFTDLTKTRERQVNWEEFMALPDDRAKKKLLVQMGTVLIDRKTKSAHSIKRERVAFLFFQTQHGKLPEDAIWAELTRLYPEVAFTSEDDR
jgi:hypothetical protein